MSIIIIEGFDETGKTTLAKALAKKLGYNYVSGGGPEVGTYNGARNRIFEGMPDKVQDRTWISELVYGNIIRKKSGISDAEVMEFIKLHKDLDIKLIYAKRSYEAIMRTIADRDQMEGVIEYAKEILPYYDYWMLGKLPIYLGSPIIYNFETTDVDDIIQCLGYIHAIPGEHAARGKDQSIRSFKSGGPSLTDG